MKNMEKNNNNKKKKEKEKEKIKKEKEKKRKRISALKPPTLLRRSNREAPENEAGS